VAPNQNGIDTGDELVVSMRLATTDWQEIVLAIGARNETVETGSNEDRQLHGRLVASDVEMSELLTNRKTCLVRR
jgi:hypothetical protein